MLLKTTFMCNHVDKSRAFIYQSFFFFFFNWIATSNRTGGVRGDNSIVYDFYALAARWTDGSYRTYTIFDISIHEPPLPPGGGETGQTPLLDPRPADDHLCQLVPAVHTRGRSFPGLLPLLQCACWKIFPILLQRKLPLLTHTIRY